MWVIDNALVVTVVARNLDPDFTCKSTCMLTLALRPKTIQMEKLYWFNQ